MILLWAIPVFWVTMLIEWRLTMRHEVIGYELKDSAASLSMGVGNLVTMFSGKLITFSLYMAAYEGRLFDIPTDAWWVWLLLVPADDFVFYWYHRLGHEVRLFWAAHVNHHSSTTYNLSTALRQSWTSPVFTWFFWLPLVVLGFHPLMIVVVQSISLLYQYWIHTELIARLGPLEWVMNTPSHHRVHHAVNPLYLDRNYGGIFIVWDRLFGSFQEESEQPTYGLTKNIETYNPIIIAFHEWWAIGRDVVKAETWRGRLGYIFARPGWREDGTGTTAVDIRKAALERTEGA
jgi:sterol desaturase/sphingolipid hydroxylase (fatty acid hydroxylase superfamily)